MSPEGIDPQEAVYGDSYKPRRKSAHQPHSDQTIRGILDKVFEAGYAEGQASRTGAVKLLLSNQAEAALTAYVKSIIGEDEPEVANPTFDGLYNSSSRNILRAEQRRKLKEQELSDKVDNIEKISIPAAQESAEMQARELWDFSKVNRVEIIDHTRPVEQGGGTNTIAWTEECLDVSISLQDNARTLKLFVRKKQER